jgi:prevent-host-death family protein
VHRNAQRLRVAIRSVCCYSGAVSKTIAQRELRNDNAKVIEAVVAGESFVVTRNGEPVAELRPIRHARRTFVPRAEIVAAAMQGPHIDSEQFREDLDRVIDQGL